MNRQYKVIWSKVKHCYIVVSELVKRNGKSSSVKSKSGQKIGVTLAVLALCFGLNGSSLAADLTDDQQAVYEAVIKEFNYRFSDLESRTDALVRETANIPKFGESDGGIAIGEDAIATPVSNIAIGYKANAGTEYSSHIAIGSLSEALGGQSIAIGNGARANTGFTIAIGHNADVARDNGESSDSIGIGTNLVNRGMRTILIGGENGSQTEPITSNFAIGIGYHAIPGDTGVAIGEWSSSGLWGNSMGAGANAKGEKSLALGFQAHASDEGDISLGHQAYSANAGAISLGHKAFAIGENTVAIGRQSYAVNKSEIVESYLSDEHIYPQDGVISVGNADYQLGEEFISERHRRITNMAGGVDDYDAANIKQLKALKREIDDVDKKVTAGGSSTKYVSFNSSEEGNKANDGATGGNAMAVGPNAQATGDGSTAVGWNAEATGIGHSAAYGANANAVGQGSLAVGPGSEAYGKSGIAIGNTAVSNTETLDESSIAIGDRAEAKSDGSIGMGIKSIASGKRSMAMGIQTQATGNYSMALGGYTSATGADSIALGHNAVAATSYSVAIGAKSVADRGYDTYGYTVDHAAFTSDAELLTYLGKIDEYNAAVDVVIANQKDYKDKEAASKADRNNEELKIAAEEAKAKLDASQQALLKLTAAYKSYFGAASVGTDFATRQITGVAAGSEDTDAVNVAQLKALNKKVNDNKLHYIAIGPDNEKNLAIGGNYNNDGADMHWGIAIGVDASSKDTGIAMGKDSRAHGEQSVGLGSLSSAIGSFTTAVGHSAQAYGDSATAYGAVARAYGASGVAIGDSALVASSKPLTKEEFEALSEEEKALYQQGVTSTQKKFYQYKQKNQSGEVKDIIVNGVAIGVAAQSIGVGGVAIGDRAKASDLNDIENSNWGVALGAYSQNKVDQGVALGTNSVSDRAKNVKGYLPTNDGLVEDFEEAMAVMGKTAEFEQLKTEYTAASEKVEQTKAAYEANPTDANLKLAYENAKQDLAKLTSKFAVMTAPWTSRKGAVSVGNDKTGQTRQIIGVAAGSEDTDAVNVAQLKALNTKVDANKIEYVSINSSVEENKANDGATATDTVAIGPKASATYEGAVAIGRNVTANGGVAIGQNSSSTSEHSVAIGLGSVAGDSLQADVAIGNVAKAAGYSVAIGNGASAFMEPDPEYGEGGLAVAIGSGAVVSGQGGVAVGQGSKAVFQSNAMGSLAKATERGAVAIGDTTEATGVGTVAIGNRAEADNVMGIAIGTYTKGLGYGTIGIGGNAEATGNWSMAMGQSSVASAKMSTALGHYSNATSEKSLAVGPYASAQTGSFATAVGYSASTRAGSAVALGSYSAASGGASMALGYDSAANINTGVALGAFSVADRASKVYGYNVDSVGFASDEDIAAYLGKTEAYQTATEDFNAKLAVYNEKKSALADDPDNEQLKTEYEEVSKAAEASFDARNAIVSAYRSGLGAISIGTVAETRQITNVAAGSEDTDAVNVAQLKGLKSLVDTKTETLEDNSKGYFHANIKEATDPTWNNYGLMSDTGGAGGLYSVAAGIEAQVNKDAEKAVAIGYRTKTKQKGGIAVGYDTVSDGERAVAIGQDAVAKGVDATALGFNAQALNAQSLALGNQAKATGAWSIAIAQDTEASGHLSLAASYGAKTAGLQSVGIGVLAATSSAAENSVAIGTMAQALGVNTTAIGPTAKVRGSHSVGVGPAATTDSTAYNGTAIGKNAYIGAVRDSGSGVGVPSDGITQGNDTEPEAGKEHMNSTALGFAAKAFGFQNLSVGAGAETYDTNTIAIGVNAVAKDHYATALGKQARATGKNSTAIGHWATSVGEDSVSIGTLSTIQGLDGQTAVNKSATLGAYSRAAIDNSVALGHESLAYVGDDVATKAYLTDEAFAKENGVVSVGNAEYTIGETTVEANRRRITNVAGGADAYDAVNVAQLQAVEAEGLNFKGDGDTVVHRDLGTELIISGGNTESTTLTENNIGVVADKDSGSLSVKLSKNVNLDDGSVTFVEMAKDADGNVLVKGEDGNWYADLTDSVYDADAQSYTKDGEVLTAVANPVVGTVKLTSTGLDNGNQRITNVAAGVQATDAVNMSQLNDLNTKVDTNKIEYVSIKSSEIENKLNDGATGDNSIAIGPKTKVTAASAVAIGSQSEISNSNFGSAYGATSKVTGSEQGTAIGYGALVDNSLFGTALGTRANVTKSLQGTAVGQSAIVSGSQYGISLGTFSKVINSDSGIAVGSMANVNNANYGMAIGINSSVTNQGGTALGYGTAVTEKSGVALGLGAMANRSGEVYGYSPDGVTFTDDASVAAYLGKTAEFEQANQDYVEKVQIFQEKLAAYQQDPRNPDVIQAYVDAANAMTESFEKRTGIIAAYKSSYGAVSVGGSGATRQIINVAAGTEDTDAVNLAQLKTVETIAKAHTELTLDGKSATAGVDGKLGDYIGDNNLTMAVKDVNGQKVYDLKLKNEVVIGQPGKDGKDGTPGSIGLVGPQGPAGEDGQPGKNAYGEISVKNGVDGVDGKHGKDGITRIVYEDENGEEHTVATLEDGLKFVGDTENVTIAKKLNETLDVKGGISDTSLLTDNNIGVVAQDKGGLTVKLAKNLNLSDGSVTIAADSAKDADGNWLVKGEDGNWYTDLTDAVYDADSQTYTKDGAALTAVESPVVGAVKLSSTGLDNGNQRIVNVATGIDGTDAVNVAQLKKEISDVTESVGGAHTELTLDGKSATAGADGALGEYIGENNLTMAVKDVNGQKVYDLKLKNEVVIGQPGKDGKDGTPGSIGLVGPQGPAGEDGQPGKNAYAEISVKNGVDGVDGKHGKDGITRIVYKDENGEERVVATLDDGLKFAGDTENVTIAKKLNQTLEVKGGISDAKLLTDNNIGVVAQTDGGLTVKLAKNLNLNDGSVTIATDSAKDENGKWLVKGEDGNWYTDLTDAVYDAATQTYTKDGAALTAVESPVLGAVKLSSTGLDNGNQRIVNVATGIDGTDAVNVAQLKKEISDVTASVGGAHTELTLDGKSATAGAGGALGEYIGENNLTMAVKDVNGQKVYDLKLKNEVVIGQPGKDGKDGTPGSIGLVGPQGPAGEDGQPGKNAYGEISVKNGVDGVDGKHGKDGITRIVYEDERGEEHTVATLEDGLKFAGDTENVTIAKKLNETLDIKGGISDASLLTDNNIGVVAKADGGLTVKLSKDLSLSDGSVAFAETAKDKDGNALVKGEDGNWYTDLTDAVYDADSQTYTKDGAALTAVESPVVGAVKLSSTGLDNGNQRIVNVATGIDKTDAVNVGQLDTAISNVTTKVGGAHTELMLDGKSATAGVDGKLGDYIGESNLTMAVKDVNGQKVYDLKLSNEVVIGTPGKDGKDGKPGSIGLVGPQGPAGEDGQPGKNAYGEISVKNGADGVDGKHGKDGITRIVYEDERGEEHTVATLEDGLKFVGDTKDVTIAKKLNETLDVKGGISDTSLLTDNNIGVVAQDKGGLTVKLAKNLNLSDGSVAFAETAKDADGNALVKGEDENWYTDLTDAVYDADSQTYTKDGATLTAVESPVVGAVKLSSTGLDNGNQRIVNVATGIDKTDAVNVGQLDTAISNVTTKVGGAHTELMLDGKSATAGVDGKLGDYIGENNLTMAVKDVNGQKVYDLKLKNEVVIGKPGKDGKDGTPGSIGLVGPQGPAGEDGQPGKNAYAEISVKNGVDGVDGKHGKDGITRIVYKDENGEERVVATMDDGLKFAGDTENVTIAKKLNETLDVKGGISDASLLTDNNIGVVAKSDGGLTVKLAKNLNLADGSVRIGGTTGDDGTVTGGIYIANQKAVPTTKDGKTEDGLFVTGLTNTKWNPDGNGIVSGRAATEDQLNTAISNVVTSVGGAHTELTLDGKSATAGADGKFGDYIGENNLTMAVKDVNGQKVYDLKLSNEIVIGTPGKDGKDGTPGSIGLVGPQGPAGEDGQPGKNAYGEISVKNGADGVDGTNGKDGMTRIVYVDENDKEHTVATLEDGLKFAGDTENVTIAKKLNETLDVKGGISDASLLTDNNIGVVAKADGGLTVKLAKNINLADGSVRIGGTTDENGVTTGGIYVANQKAVPTTKDGKTEDGLFVTGLTNTKWNPDANGIVSGRAATEDQLNAAISNVVTSVGGAHTELTLDGKSATAGANGELGDYIGENNLTMAVKDVNGQKVYDLKLKNEVVIGQPGKDGKDGKPGSIGLVGPQGPAGEDGQPGKNAYGEISVKNGADGVDGKNGKDGMTRIVYVDENDKEHTVATLEDGLKFAGDTEHVTIPKKLNETLEVKGGISDASLLTDNNIGVVAKADGGLTVKLAKNLNLADGSVRIGGTTGDDGTVTGGIYIANQKAVPTTKDGKTEDGLFITGLANTDWNPDSNGIVESRAATEKQLKAVADSSAKVDATNLSNDNVSSWKTKLGITDTLLGEAGAWKLTVNGTGERSIKKDSVINFVNGEKVQITQNNNDIKVGLDAEFVKQVSDNTTNITNLDNRVTKVEGDVKTINQNITKINNDITNINTKIETIEGKAGVANVIGDTETGVKVEKVDPNDATKGVKVSLEEKIKVGGITIDGKLPSEGETANRTITGLTNTTWDADHVVDDRAATEGQLKDLSQKIKEVGEIKDGVRTYASDDSGDNPLKRKNSDAMELRGGADSDNLSDDNIGVVTNSQKTGFDIKLSKDLKGLNSAEIGNVSISNNITVGTGDKKTVITDNSVTTGNTTINNDGLTIKNEDSSKNITIQTGNVNMGGNAIHNVGEATEANDAINKAQLDRTVTAIGAGMNEMSGRIGSLDRRVNRVGAGAAALAALHPLEYSPDAKWEVTAGLGNYRSTSAVALGAFYRPNYDTLFSIGATYGGGENMVNAGVTWRIGEGETKNYPSKQVMAQEIDTLKSALAQQNDKIESQSEQLEEQNKKIEQLMQAIEKLTK